MGEGGLWLLATLANLVHERNHGIFDLGTEGIEGRRGKAALMLVEPDVIRIGLGIHKRCLVLEGIDDAVDVGLEACPVVSDLCLVPDGLRLAGQARPSLGFFGGDSQRFVLIAREDTCLGAKLLVFNVAGFYSVEQVLHLFDGGVLGEQLVVFARERAHRLGAGGGAVLGRDGGAIELGDLHQVAAAPKLALKLAYRGRSLLCWIFLFSHVRSHRVVSKHTKCTHARVRRAGWEALDL